MKYIKDVILFILVIPLLIPFFIIWLLLKDYYKHADL